MQILNYQILASFFLVTPRYSLEIMGNKPLPINHVGKMLPADLFATHLLQENFNCVYLYL
jgi:hypothetical protein